MKNKLKIGEFKTFVVSRSSHVTNRTISNIARDSCKWFS